MKLSDVMSAMNLSAYAEIALVLFLAAFALIAYEVLRNGRELETFSRLPLDEKPTPRNERREELS